MNLLRKKVFPGVAFLLLAALAAGCQGPSKRVYTLKDGELYARDWQNIVLEKPVAKDENIRLTDLFVSENSSQHVLQVNSGEEPHIYEYNDLTMILKEGEGTLNLRDKVLPMSAGDVVFIPRGTPNWFVNDRKGSPAIAYLIFSPPFDGKGTRPFYLPDL